MLFNFGFYSSLLLIFFVHTIVYSFLLLKKYYNQQQTSSFWLSIFLLLSASYITPWMLGFAGWYSMQPYRDILFYTPFQHVFLIGPILYFYIQSLLNPAFQFKKKYVLHFLPAILYFLYCVLMVIYDKLIVKEYYFLADQSDRDLDAWYQIAGFISMIIYFIVSIQYYNIYKKILVQVLSNADDFAFTWVRNFFIAFLTLLIAWVILIFFETFFEMSYAKAWWYFFSYAIICYYIAIEGYANAVKSKIFFKSNLLQPQKITLLLPTKQILFLEPYQKTETSDLENNNDIEEFEQWKKNIETLITKERLYENAELSLPELSKRLQINIPLLSKIINKGFGLNFNDFINQYRIEAVIDALMLGKHKKNTLLGIAFDCGFNSKSTFNRAFKKHTALSPQEFIKKNINV